MEHSGNETVDTLIDKIAFFVINPFISILFGAAFLVFLWGVFKYFWQQDSESARTDGIKHIMYGLIGMLVMFGAFVLVRVVANTIGSDVEIP